MRTVARILLALTAAAVISAGAGCYSKVVGARGPGADTIRIEQPNAPAPDGRTLGYPKYNHRSMPGG